jgi:hypothetical protein
MGKSPNRIDHQDCLTLKKKISKKKAFAVVYRNVVMKP